MVFCLSDRRGRPGREAAEPDYRQSQDYRSDESAYGTLHASR